MSDLVRRDDVLTDIIESLKNYYVDGKPLIEDIAEDVIHSAVCNVPAVDAVEVDKVAQMFYEFMGDDCPCDYNDNDEWLWNFCDGDNCLGEGLECWKLFVKHYGERREENALD